MTHAEHQWTDSDNLVAYHLYRLGNNSLPLSKPELAETMGMSLASLNYKISNFKAIDGRGGFEGYSHQAARTYKQYSSIADTELTEAAIRAVAQALEFRMTLLKDMLERRCQ